MPIVRLYVYFLEWVLDSRCPTAPDVNAAKQKAAELLPISGEVGRSSFMLQY
jgi:hypothetical protein